MPDNIKLSDSIIARALQLQRVVAKTDRDIVKILDDMLKVLIFELSTNDINDLNRDELISFYIKINNKIKESYEKTKDLTEEALILLASSESLFVKNAIQKSITNGTLDITFIKQSVEKIKTIDIVDVETKFFSKKKDDKIVVVPLTKRPIQSIIPINLSIATPTKEFLDTLAKDTLIEGLPSSVWWSKQEEDVKRRFRDVVRSGLSVGDTPTHMARQLRDTLSVSKANAQSLVQTSTNAVSNRVRVEVFEKNSDVIGELKWLTTLDNRVCNKCIAIADKRWKNNAEHTPIGHSTPFRRPPIHFNDRCVIVPIAKSFKELGIDLPEPKQGTRPSVVDSKAVSQPGGTTFRTFLDRQSKSFQDETLGPGRADLWRAGKISLTDLTDGRGRELTIKELKS